MTELPAALGIEAFDVLHEVNYVFTPDGELVNPYSILEVVAPLIEKWAREDQARKDAKLSANIVLLHEIPTPGTGPFTIQQQAADEARVQISAAILKSFSSGE